MKKIEFATIICLMMLVLTHAASGQSIPEAPVSAPESVTITVSTEGLGKYSEEFSATVLRLERLLEEAKRAELSLPTEDLQRLEALVVSSTRLIETIGENAEQVATVIQDAQAPVLDISAKVMDQAEQRVVAPMINGVDRAVNKASWTVTVALVVLGILVIMVLMYVAAGAYFLNHRMQSIFTGMGKIIDGHVVVPRDTWAAATASLTTEKAHKPTND
ncbi:MAG: hypothetical protein AB8G16_09035 [Gammaproteobacteria bacterium]